jgi:hypothetical protein
VHFVRFYMSNKEGAWTAKSDYRITQHYSSSGASDDSDQNPKRVSNKEKARKIPE